MSRVHGYAACNNARRYLARIFMRLAILRAGGDTRMYVCMWYTYGELLARRNRGGNDILLVAALSRPRGRNPGESNASLQPIIIYNNYYVYLLYIYRSYSFYILRVFFSFYEINK